ncbi:MAG: type 4a pilus biogenesis protein PilO [Gaiellaceae bacterium]
MKAPKLSPAMACVLIGVAGAVVLAAGMFLLVMPQGHKASKLGKEIDTTRTQIVAAKALATQRPEAKIRAADLFKVVEAMPDETDMTGTILQLQQTAGEAGVRFDSIQPGVAAAGAGYDIQPVDLAFEGNYFSLTDFLYRLRRLVEVRHGKLDASGRLFSVGKIDFQPAEGGFPRISATVTVNSFAYNAVSADPMSGVPPTDTTTTTTTPSSGAAATGAPS